ncbi:peroxiredoxin [Aureimonas pseudogalii]|uniref:Peroxiredoxin n=1 Tax=Aureimonas pseudogalii TaxID=1744844 RepID=A0A7W6MKD7_9HYPH|nr:peroxiredoxin [Aureimonas pseudogalii]MBB3998937.1 peroxiredoxin [Aureimonas pseudogalii]
MTDLTQLPEGLEPPIDDGASAHLVGRDLPMIALPSTAGPPVDLGRLKGTAILYFYPMTGRPGAPLPGGWNEIPGARGCTPQACGFRDHFAELRGLGVSHVFGISSQTTAYQREAATRLNLPFALLSDAGLELQEMLDLPTFEVDGERLFKRLTMVMQGGAIAAVFYPVFPPDRSAADLADWLRARAPETRPRH